MTIMEAISQGFHKTQHQASVSLATFAAALFFIPLIALLYKAVARNRRNKAWEEDFQSLIREKDLTINEIDLLESLSSFLRNPGRKTLLLQNHNTLRAALGLLETENGDPKNIGPVLEKKLFGTEESSLPEDLKNPIGAGHPARYIAPDGRVFTGKMKTMNDTVITLSHVEPTSVRDIPGKGRLLVQDFRGISTYSVSSVSQSDADSLQLKIAQGTKGKNEKISLSSIFVYPSKDSRPIETRLLRLKDGIGDIENPGGILKKGQAVKLTFHTDLDKYYRVNAVVIGLSGQKKVARLKFGYLKSIS